MANQMDALNVTSRMIKDALSCKIVETSLFRLKLKANERERFSRNHSNTWENSECLGWIL